MLSFKELILIDNWNVLMMDPHEKLFLWNIPVFKAAL